MQKVCKQCKASFEVTEDDLSFLDKLSPILSGKKYPIPTATLCPDCRQQRRMAWRNERSLYRRKCDKTGEMTISMYPPDLPCTVYSQKAWWSDSWDPRDYGCEVDFNRPFYEQLGELIRKSPLIAVINMNTENSEYCHRIFDGRNNYMSTIALYSPENLIHTYYTIACKDCTDVSFAQYCELCYELTDAERCYGCRYGRRLHNCTDCVFCEDCMGCSNCFGCKNLHQKSYCIYNKQKTPEEYRAFLQQCPLDSTRFVRETKQRAATFFLTLPNRATLRVNAEDVTGAHVFHCRSSYEIYDFYESEYMRYCSLGEKSNHCMDCYGMGVGEWCYESVTLQSSTGILFSASSFHSSNLICCHDSYADTRDCFGCSGMKRGQHCILNKQYTKEDYDALVPRIIEHMRGTGEWGECMPRNICPFGYNETSAQEYHPLTRERALAEGWQWREADHSMPKVSRTIAAAQLPDKIKEIPDDILNWALLCESTSRPYRLVKQELDFYKRLNITVPRLHPDERHRLRMQGRNPRKLWKRDCAKCKQEIQTNYPLDRPEIIYCNDCYLKAVY